MSDNGQIKCICADKYLSNIIAKRESTAGSIVNGAAAGRLAFRPTSSTQRDRKTQRVMVAFYFILFTYVYTRGLLLAI